MADLRGRAPHADTDPRRRPDPDRVNMPEGLRRARKSAYGPTTGRRGQQDAADEARNAKDPDAKDKG